MFFVYLKMGDTRKRRSTKKETNTPTVPDSNKASEKENIRKKLQSKNYKNSANSDNSPTASIVKTLIFSILIFVSYLFISSNNFELLFDLTEKIQKYTKTTENIQNHAVPDATQQSTPQSTPQPTETPTKPIIPKPTMPAAYAKYYKQLKPTTPKPADIESILKKSRSHLNGQENLISEPSCHYRRLLGMALSIKAENQRSNSLLKESIKEMNLMPPTCEKREKRYHGRAKIRRNVFRKRGFRTSKI